MRRALTLALVACGTLVAGDLTADDVLRAILESQARQEQLQNQFVWHEHVEFRHLNSDGTAAKKADTVREFEVSYESGSVYRTLVSENGKPLTPRQASKKKVLARRQVTPLASWIAGRTNRLIRGESIDGRDCWVIESDPGPGQSPYRRTLWIDKTDKAVTRIHDERLGKATPGTAERDTIFFQKNDAGVWLISRSELMVRTELQTIDFSGYRRFTTDSAVHYAGPN